MAFPPNGDTLALAERLRNAAINDQKESAPRMSLGVAYFPGPVDALDGLMHNADTTMYQGIRPSGQAGHPVAV